MRAILIVSLLFSAGLNAQTVLLDRQDLAKAAELRDQAMGNHLAYEILESLTTEVGPRMAGTPGDARAVAWAKAKFEELGFDRVLTEPVKFPQWERIEESAEIVSPFPQKLHVTALGGSIKTPKRGVKAKVVEFATLADLEAVADDSLNGEIVYISNRMTRARDGSGYGPAVVARSSGASVAAAKGASAVLIRSIGTDHDRLPHTGMMRYEDQNSKIPAAALSNPDADLLSNMLKRDQDVVIDLNLQVGFIGEATSYNVIGDIIGSERPDEFIIIGGHLDSWDLGTGAVDDGAGCALTMAAASLIKSSGLKPKRTIRVVLYANEEQGLYGARAYHQAHLTEMDKHIIGAESDFGAGRIYGFSSRVKPEALGAIDQINQVLAPIGISRGNNEASGGPDLIPMRAAGMAVATLHQDGSDYFDLHHTANDTLDKVDPDALAQNMAAYIVFAYLTAQYDDDFGFGLGLEGQAGE